jgi:hypothetical protein
MDRPRQRGRLSKATDLWCEAEGQTLGGRRVPFEKAFPTIANVVIRVEDGLGSVRVFRKGEFGEYIDCTEPYCDGGGVSIGSIIRQMVSDRAPHHTTTEVCCGQERNPGRGRRPGGVRGPCTKVYKISVDLEFTQLSPPNEEADA